MVLGVLAVLFGTVVVFVGPVIIDDQVVKVSTRRGSTSNTCSAEYFKLHRRESKNI